MKKTLQTMFLDYFNDFLSIAGFAEYYGISETKALRVIKLGKQIHERQFN